MLTLTRLEDLAPPVSLLFDWTFSPFPEGSPLAEAIRQSAVATAARLSSMAHPSGLPAGDRGYTALTQWGPVWDEPPARPDTLTVYVGAAGPGQLGVGGPVSWSASGGGLNRSPGFVLGVDPNPLTWATFSLPATVEHEVVHGAAALSHSPDERAVMYHQQAPGVDKPFTPADVSLVRQAGWEMWTMPGDAVVKCKGGVWGSGGFALLSLREAGIRYQQGWFTDYEMLPAGTPVIQ